MSGSVTAAIVPKKLVLCGKTQGRISAFRGLVSNGRSFGGNANLSADIHHASVGTIY